MRKKRVLIASSILIVVAFFTNYPNVFSDWIKAHWISLISFIITVTIFNSLLNTMPHKRG